MDEVIEGLLYTRSHEWVQKMENHKVRMGITDHAQHELGDIVYTELPKVGISINKGDEAGALESVKTVEPFYTPLGGKILQVNEALETQPELINKSPYGEGWLMEMDVSSIAELDDLMDHVAYAQMLKEI